MSLELLTLIVSIPFFLFLAVFFSPFCVLFFVLWMYSLCFDMYSTYQFYLQEPSRFKENERNKLFSSLVGRVGFRKAMVLFPVMFEVPLLVFFAALPLQILQAYMFSTVSKSLLTCLTVSFGVSAVGHLQAAIKNTHINHHRE